MRVRAVLTVPHVDRFASSTSAAAAAVAPAIPACIRSSLRLSLSLFYVSNNNIVRLNV